MWNSLANSIPKLLFVVAKESLQRKSQEFRFRNALYKLSRIHLVYITLSRKKVVWVVSIKISLSAHRVKLCEGTSIQKKISVSRNNSIVRKKVAA